MATIAQKLYLALPRQMQEIAITAYGVNEYRKRYGRELGDSYSDIGRLRSLPAEELNQLQNARLKALVRHAAETVPHYQQLFRELRLDPKEVDINNFRDLIPILEKSQVVSAPHAFCSTSVSGASLRLFTSGTSGSPMPILATTEARAINYAYFRDLLRRHGSDVRRRSATFAGRVLFSEREKAVYWRRDYLNSTLFLSSYHISDQSIPGYLSAMEAWNPEYIDSYPSAVGEVARFILDNNISHAIRPKFVVTSSETLSEIQAEQISRAFNCPVVDHYGCSEMAVSAAKHDLNKYTLDPLYALVEFEPGAVPGSNALICTGLINFGMPLLRYRIGDSVMGASASADMPFCNQTFSSILGREDDLILTPEGRRVGRLDPAFKGLEGVQRAQIIQDAIDALTVLVIASDKADKALIEQQLTENLIGRTSRSMKIFVKFVEDIELTRSGKFKSVVSRVR